MAINVEPITPGMTKGEKEAIALSALIRFPNPDVVSGKLKCGKMWARRLAEDRGIACIYIDEPKFEMMVTRLEKNMPPERITGELGGHRSTAYRVQEHLKWYSETIRMLNAADRGWKKVDGVRADEMLSQKAEEKNVVKSATVDRPNARPMSDKQQFKSLLKLAGVQTRNPKRPAIRDGYKTEPMTEVPSGPA